MAQPRASRRPSREAASRRMTELHAELDRRLEAVARQVEMNRRDEPIEAAAEHPAR